MEGSKADTGLMAAELSHETRLASSVSAKWPGEVDYGFQPKIHTHIALYHDEN